MNQEKIRNFCIIAHIDHGKSTLADRLMELTETVDKRDMKSQLLDSMDLEREKGITIKLAPVRMNFRDYKLNLIDTPGHVDFSYEVSRSLEACEGALLVVDATQGVQAQTLANVYLAINANLTIIPVLNKIDLPAADVDNVSNEIINLLGCNKEDILLVSAKTGQGIDKVLEEIITKIPSPKGFINKPTRSLIFDSYFDDFRGVVLYTRIVDGEIKKGDQIIMMATNQDGIALEVGYLNPKMKPVDALESGDIGYIVTNLKSAKDAKVGDTITVKDNKAVEALKGYKNIKPFVYAGFFPISNEYFMDLKDAVEKLALSDSALSYEQDNSPVLGHGLRIGFLGLLHLDIIKERLEREFNLELIITNPSTDYQVELVTGEMLDIKSASDLPDQTKIKSISEPWLSGEIIVPNEFVGSVIKLIVSKRGIHKNISYLENRAIITFEAPLANLLTDFYDQLKNVSSGFGTFNYEISDYRQENLVKVDFYIASEIVDALSIITHKDEAFSLGSDTVKKLKDIIPRQAFKVSLQAAIGGKFIAREDISAYRKDVTAKLYGGDVSRRKKLLQKQVRGKQRMKKFGKVDIPPSAFTVMLRRER